MHKPVMVNEIVKLTEPKKDSIIIDATFGFGGHSKAFYEIIENGLIIGFEKNEMTYEIVKKMFKNYSRILIYNVGYENMAEIIEKLGFFNKVDIVIFDLGLSSFLIERSGLGFSYKRNEILDMRFSQKEGKPLYQLLETLTQKEIERILKNYGDIKNPYRISQTIIDNKPIRTTKDLVNILKKITPRNKLDKTLKKVFQAFRIYVNDEIENIKKGILNAYKCLKVGGRIAVLSYHSIEDRVIKSFYRSPLFIPILKKPLKPSDEEIIINPRARSAKLRILIKK
jgi:16S rRNA (cytosine1402-N4)-methyltransferase